jgi:hypothetical protein
LGRLVILGLAETACLGAPLKPSPVAETAVSVEAEPALDANERRQIVEDLARNLEDKYLVAPDGARMAAMLRTRLAADAYDMATRREALAELLESEVRGMSSDAHLRVFSSTEPPPSPPAPGSAPPPELVASLRKQELHGGIQDRKILAGNIGYLALWGVPMVEVARDDISEAFAFLHDTAALIIDNRDNRGGDPQTVALYVSYLTRGPSVLFSRLLGRNDIVVQEFKTEDLGALSYGRQKPVYVLTSNETFSGGEALSYHLQALKRAIVIGEPTRGGARRAEIVSIGRDVYATIPVAQARSPFTGGNWEGLGVQPDVRLPAASALLAAEQAAAAQLRQRE